MRHRFTVLGPVRAWRETTELTLTAQLRAFLAILLIRPGRPVAVGEIVDTLWGERPPTSAANSVHKHASKLRRLLEEHITPREQGRWLVRQDRSYLFRVAPEQLDLLSWRRLVERARLERDRQDLHRAFESYTGALRLWHGRCGANLGGRIRQLPAFHAVEREFESAVREVADLALVLGRAGQVLPMVREAAAADPLDEPMQARLLLVLAASGHQSRALSTYRAVRDRLADELGVDPGAELRLAYERVLRQEVGTVVPRRATPIVRPAQLPAAVPGFVGRTEALAALDAAATCTESGPLTVLAGGPGIGKSALAVHWAHRGAHWFPDGQLYVDLRGSSPLGALDPADALRHFLTSLGQAPDSLPDSSADRGALFRSLLAGRRVLVVLDDAAAADQVRPLLPGGTGCLVLVTSRATLTGLRAMNGARSIAVDPLTPAEARCLLAVLVTEARVAAEPDAAAALGRLCEHHPVALRVAAVRLAAEPTRPIADYVRELTLADRLASLRVEGDAATEAFSEFVQLSG
ncbi:AfsR/SARP family transcriptional regulator [Actinophytocola sediminis]